MSPIGITLLMAAAFAAFFYLAWRKLAIVLALGPEVRWDEPLARLRRVVTNGFLQSRMIRGERKPGIMHAVIFAGFLALLARKLQLIVIGYDSSFVYPGALGAAFTLGKDLVEIAVLLAVGYAFFRRFVLKPARLERNREATLILSLIAAIMITDFLFDGFRFALAAASDPGIAHEARYAVVGAAIARALAGMSETALDIGLQLSYWVQMGTVFAFLVFLPIGEHFHIVTALPALFFARRIASNRVPSVDLDKVMEGTDESAMKVGVHTAADLVWKDGLDAFTCTECGRCKDACPTFVTGKPLALKWVFDHLKEHLLAQREALLARREDALPPLVPTVIGEDSLWACTTCGYCEAACPIELEHLPRFYRLRQHQVMMEGVFPRELKAVFDGYEVQSNPWGLPAETRGDWARDLDVPLVTTVAEVKELDWLFYVGSAESFDPRGQRIARAFVSVMRAAGVRIGILGAGETSTGECVRRAGNEMLFQTLAQQLVATLNGLGATRIVTCDPHAFNSLRNEYPEFGGHYEVVHHTQLIARLIADGRLPLAPRHEKVIYHEPCYLGRHNGEYEAPRRALAAVCRDAPLEFALARDKAMCCGAGGGRMWLEENIGRRINVTRVEQALGRAPAIIATACPYCAEMMGDGVAALGHDEGIATRDIAELVAEALVPAARPA
jgi:Fe-S oxidoreductase